MRPRLVDSRGGDGGQVEMAGCVVLLDLRMASNITKHAHCTWLLLYPYVQGSGAYKFHFPLIIGLWPFLKVSEVIDVSGRFD